MIEPSLLGGLAVTDVGDGPTVLFLHGIGSSRSAFDDQVAGLADRYRCLCPDAPGYADSPDPNPIADMDGYAEIYERLIGDAQPMAIVGVSFGGVVAARMAIRANLDIAALVLADTSRGSGIDADRASAMRARPPALEELGAERLATERSSRLLSSDAPSQLVDRVAANMARSIRLPGYSYAAEAMASTDHTAAMAEIACPTLVVVGDGDEICPPAEARRIVDLIPEADYAEIAGAGHLANQEQPEAFNEVVAGFLDQHISHSSTNTIGQA